MFQIDDHSDCISIQISVYWSVVFQNSEKPQHTCEIKEKKFLNK